MKSFSLSITDVILELQKNTLTKELSSLQKVLKSDQLRHQQLTESYDRVRENLLELTEKRQQRQMRAEVRNKRAVARLTDDPALLQLSEENRHLLKEAIDTEHKKLHQKKEQLMQRAIEISYQTYLTRLEIYLQSTVSRNYQENEALKQIIQFMREYLLIIAEEQKIRLTRNNTFLEKEKIVKDKPQTEKKVEQLKQSNPALALQNISLGKENEQLEISIQERGSYKNTLLKIGLFFFLLTAGGACAGVTVAGGILAVTALFMVPAAVLAVIMLSLFIAALIYTIKNSIDSNQLTKNQTIIKDNIATISQQDSEMMLLESQILPELAKKTSEAEHNLSMLDKSIERLHQHAELKLNTAKQVTVQFPSSQLPFIGKTSQRTPQDTYQNSIKTPTSFIDDLTERNVFTHQ